MSLTEETQVKKKAKLRCIIHCSDDNSDDYTRLKDLESWKSLLNAARIRSHEELLSIAESTNEGEIPDIVYHRKCRSLFTMKKLLDKIEKKEEEKQLVDNDGSCRRSLRNTGTLGSHSRVYDKVCIFCNKSNKYIKFQKTREALQQCVELRADERIRTAASKKADKRVLALLSRDLVAAEGHYHVSCYKIYTKESQPSKNQEFTENNPIDGKKRSAYKKVYELLRADIIHGGKIIYFTDITSHFEETLRSLNVGELIFSLKKHLRRQIETEFGDSIKFVADEKGKLIVYSGNLLLHDLIREIVSLRRQVDDLIKGDKLTQAATEIRATIKSKTVIQSWPPDTSENIVPPEIIKFFAMIIAGGKAGDAVTQKVKRIAQSFSSDLVFAVTNGKMKPSKHIVLAFGIKSLTGNTEVIRVLNRLGHCISYSQMEELDTELCIQKMESGDDECTLPKSLFPSIFTTLAWDNIDRLEETLSGEGTSHRVNGIAVQQQVSGPLPQISQRTARSHKRTINLMPNLIAAYNVGTRCGPPNVKALILDGSQELQNAKMKDYVWIISRASTADDQHISSWTGFNIKTRDEISVAKDIIHYLPTIFAPATEMATVNELLTRSMNVMHSLQLSKVVCVMDQALYSKAVEITWKHSDKFRGIILRMGDFHTICNLLSIIGKRFRDAGLQDICVESGIIAEGSVSGVLEGRRYNRAVRLHKLIYEVLLRLAWKKFVSWLEEKQDTNQLYDINTAITYFKDEISQKTFTQMLSNESFTVVMKAFFNYLNDLRKENILVDFWMSYIDMVEILLNLIRSSREGNWQLHMASIKAMIPWCFTYDKVNYARYLSYYYSTMSRLQEDHSDIYDYFMTGGFAVQLGDRNPFGRIPVDQAIEETVNKDTQTAGGTKVYYNIYNCHA